MEYLPGRINDEDDPIESALWDSLTVCIDDLVGVFAFKMPSFGENDLESIPTFVLRTENFGILIIDVVSNRISAIDEEAEFWEDESGNDIYSRDITLALYRSTLEEKMKKNKELYDLRKRAWKANIDIKSVLVFTRNTKEEINDLFSEDNELISDFIAINSYDEVCNIIKRKNENSLKIEELNIVSSILDGSDVFSKTRRKKVNKEINTINDLIRNSLDYTFKLDNIQRQIALQVPDGPQRIRGLAGTGKTVILCMKAAIAHRFLPKAKILFVFNTQSMYNQVRRLITDYYINESGQQPNWQNLHILHAWGGSSQPGLYYNTAKKYNVKPKNFMEVRHHSNALDAIYKDLNKNVKQSFVGEYDIVLIDEAQDFPASFFETVYGITNKVSRTNSYKRIVWAYDEFQTLTDIKIKQPSELFGLNADGVPNMPDSVLDGEYKGGIEKDFVLPNSYRNPRINLLVAHGLALGLYSESGKVPIENKKDWEARGYEVVEPNTQTYNEGDKVIVKRPDEYSKNILENLISSHPGRSDDELLVTKGFDDLTSELDYSVKLIVAMINSQKVEPEEIVVINLDARKAKQQYEYLRQQLDIKGVKAITPGYIEKSNAFKEKGYVTLSTPFRAKGNEANIIIVLNSQRIALDSTFKNRNAIFVAITRSRGWCYVLGYGPKYSIVDDEIQKIKKDYPYFKFVYPNEDAIKRRLTIIQSSREIEKIDKSINTILSDDAYRALLFEKLSNDQEYMNEIERLDIEDEEL